LLTKLISNGDLEEPEIASVLKYTIPRLKDKASSVRKHAAALLCAIISGYPIIAKVCIMLEIPISIKYFKD